MRGQIQEKDGIVHANGICTQRCFGLQVKIVIASYKKKSCLNLGESGIQFHQYLLNAYEVLDTALGTGDVCVNKADKNPCLQGVYVLCFVNSVTHQH